MIGQCPWRLTTTHSVPSVDHPARTHQASWQEGALLRLPTNHPHRKTRRATSRFLIQWCRHRRARGLLSCTCSLRSTIFQSSIEIYLRSVMIQQPAHDTLNISTSHFKG